MIETVMIFALGFLAASLCALMVLPAVSARATRLAKRRLEGLFPLSASEIAAEKDYLRARFAVTQRRLERKVEAARSSRHADMAAIGARTVEIAALARTMEERDSALSQTRTTLEGVERDLAAARAEGTLSLATLTVLEGAHRDLLDDLHVLRGGTATPDSASGAVDRESVSGDPQQAPSDTDLPARYAALLTECEGLRRSNAAPDEEIAVLRRRIVEVADSLLQRERLPAVEAFNLAGGPPGAAPVKTAEHA